MPDEIVEIDSAELATCRETIVALQRAYLMLTSGNNRVKVRHEAKWVEYHPGSAQALLQLINMVWAQCDDTEGLLDFNPGNRSKRGPPAYLRITR
jgi:hypothetical protein